MRLALTATMFFALTGLTTGAEDATQLATRLLDRGAKLFDQRDATTLAATYTMDAEIRILTVDGDSGAIKEEIKSGRLSIESGYRDMFENMKDPTTSRNVVESAKLVGSDILIITGTFEPNLQAAGKVAFVQERVRTNGEWLLRRLSLYLMPQ